MKAYIKAISAYVPEKRLSNDDLAKMVDTSDEWIFSHTGIKNRHISKPNETTSDLCLKAAKKVLDKAKLKPEDIDLIITATATPDYVGFPSTACIVQDKLKAENAGALDITAACTGFIYGIEIAKNFIESGSLKNILVMGGEVLSKIVDWKDRNSCVLFGDGAGAAIVSCSESGNSQIINSILKADGSGYSFLQRPAGGIVKPFTQDIKVEETYMLMDGRKVYNFAVKVLCQVIDDLLKKNNFTMNDIAYIVPHQANVRIIEAASSRTGIPLEKFYMNIHEYANTSAASIPIALNEMDEKNLLKRGDIILTIGFGGGLTYGGNIIKW